MARRRPGSAGATTACALKFVPGKVVSSETIGSWLSLLVARRSCSAAAPPALAPKRRRRRSRAAASGACSRPSTLCRVCLDHRRLHGRPHQGSRAITRSAPATTGHAESIEVVYDPQKVSYADLLKVFWQNVDATDADGQFCDRGDQYRSAIFYHDDEQKRLAEKSKRRGRQRVAGAGPDRHGDRSGDAVLPSRGLPSELLSEEPDPLPRSTGDGCGRDHRLEEVWGVAPAH